MQEEFLVYLWRYKLIMQPLTSTGGENIEILNPGEMNFDSGPDFFNARIRIGDTTWAGNIEIHIKSSDWFRHGHQTDQAYRNTILHVVYEHDLPHNGKDLPGLPVLEIKNRYNEEIYLNYHNFITSRSWIPCATQLRDVNHLTIDSWLENLAIERLEKRSERLLKSLENNTWNWEQSFYEFVARAFGSRVNADTFERLAHSLPLTALAREKNDLTQLEALLFGQAGMLEDEPADDYQFQLKTAYKNLWKKYNLEPIPYSSWKFMRLRPPNFPTIRIAQFAELIHRSVALFSKAMNCQSAEELFAMFQCQCSSYWNNHYRFGKTSPSRSKKMGEETTNLILVNTVIPFMFVYGQQRGIPALCDRSISFLDRLPPEENQIIRKWRIYGLAASNALSSQALLELKDKYCNTRLCLDCRIGHELMQKKL
jgi:hypothetical protein